MTEPERSITYISQPRPQHCAWDRARSGRAGSGVRGRSGQRNGLVFRVQGYVVAAAASIDGGASLRRFGDGRRVFDTRVVVADHHARQHLIDYEDVAAREVDYVLLACDVLFS